MTWWNTFLRVGWLSSRALHSTIGLLSTVGTSQFVPDLNVFMAIRRATLVLMTSPYFGHIASLFRNAEKVVLRTCFHFFKCFPPICPMHLRDCVLLVEMWSTSVRSLLTGLCTTMSDATKSVPHGRRLMMVFSDHCAVAIVHTCIHTYILSFSVLSITPPRTYAAVRATSLITVASFYVLRLAVRAGLLSAYAKSRSGHAKTCTWQNFRCLLQVDFSLALSLCSGFDPCIHRSLKLASYC